MSIPAILVSMTLGTMGFQNYSDPVPVDPNLHPSDEFFVVDSADRIHVLYEPRSGPHRLRTSVDAGDSWIERPNLPSFGRSGEALALAADPLDPGVLYLGTRHVTQNWADVTQVRVSRDGGESWEDPWTLEQSGASDAYETCMAQSPESRALAVAWRTWPGGIRIGHSTDQGRTFSSPLTVDPLGDHLLGLGYTADDALVCVYGINDVWQGWSAHARRSQDNGRTWSDPVELISLPYVTYVWAADVLTMADTVHAAWADESSVRHSMSTDGGRTWASASLAGSEESSGVSLVRPTGSNQVLLSYVNTLGYRDLWQHSWRSGAWSPQRRIANRIGEVLRSAGLASDSQGRTFACYSTDHLHPVASRVVVSRSDPHRPVDVGVHLHDDSNFLFADPGDPVAIDLVVTNWGAVDATVDLWIQARGASGFSARRQFSKQLLISGGETLPLRLTGRIPASTPADRYDLSVHAGSIGPPKKTDDSDGFITWIGSGQK